MFCTSLALVARPECGVSCRRSRAATKKSAQVQTLTGIRRKPFKVRDGSRGAQELAAQHNVLGGSAVFEAWDVRYREQIFFFNCLSLLNGKPEHENMKISHTGVKERRRKWLRRKDKSLQRAEVDKVVVRMTNFPHEIRPVRPPGIETLLRGGLSLHTHYR